MFTPADRDAVRESLVAAAHADDRIVAAAVTGSRALDQEDAWSDIDLAFALAPDADRGQVLDQWTARMYQHGAVHHVDVIRGAALYRVFLLRNTLQVDVAFWPENEFGAIAPSFRLLFGSAKKRPSAPTSSFEEVVGMSWLYALHARSSIARSRPWQAEHMISGMRDYVLSLACLRHGLPTIYARGVDRLPIDVTDAMANTLVRSLERSELSRAFAAVCEALLAEVNVVDGKLGEILSSPINELRDFGLAAESPRTC